jgi:chitinase
MNYGPCGIDMGQAAIDAANQTFGQLNRVGLTTQNIGILPMLGVNDVSCETFTTQDAQQLVAWSNGNSRVAMLSFWALGRDTVNFDYLAIFKNFQ